MTNSTKKAPGLKWMLIATLVILIAAGIWGGVSAANVGPGLVEAVDVNPVVGLIGLLAAISIFAIAVYSLAGVLLFMWVVYGIFLLILYFVRKREQKKNPEEVIDDDLCDG